MMSWALVSAVNDPGVLEHSLLRSPDVASASGVILKSGYDSAGKAYNAALEECDTDICLFAHQDVFFPAGWMQNLYEGISLIEQSDPGWGVIGLFGIDTHGVHRGHVYSTGLKRMLGQPEQAAVLAVSVDELAIVLNRHSRLTFDSELPGFHLYGTDICLEAMRRGVKCYIISNCCVHNSVGIGHSFPRAFWHAYRFMQRKWNSVLPVKTACATIYRNPLRSESMRIATGLWRRIRRTKAGDRADDPSELWQRIMEATCTAI